MSDPSDVPPPDAEEVIDPEDFIYHNPWTYIWRHPRRTIRQMARIEDDKAVFWIPAVIGTFYTLPIGAPVLPFNTVFGLILCFSGFLLGPLLMRFIAKLLKITGGWFGGKANAQQLRSCLAWAQAPLFLPFVVGLVYMICSRTSGLGWLATALQWSFFVVPIVVFIVVVIATVGGVADVHKFGIGKSLLSLFLSSAVTTFVVYFFVAVVTIALIPFVMKQAHERRAAQQEQTVKTEEEMLYGYLQPVRDQKREQEYFTPEGWVENLELITKYQMVTGKRYTGRQDVMTEKEKNKLRKAIEKAESNQTQEHLDSIQEADATKIKAQITQRAKEALTEREQAIREGQKAEQEGSEMIEEEKVVAIETQEEFEALVGEYEDSKASLAKFAQGDNWREALYDLEEESPDVVPKALIPPEPVFDTAALSGYSGALTIQLKDGGSLEGTLLGMTGADLMIDTPKGIKNVRIEDIENAVKKES